MLDNLFRHIKDRLLNPLARPLRAVSPITLTLIALIIGLLGIGLISQNWYWGGLLCWWLNRFLDGLDGTVARIHHKQSDWGGYLDILADFVIYAGLPIALVAGQPALTGYLALACLLGSFYVNTASWMYLAAILEKRNQGSSSRGELTTVTMPTGLIGGTETIIFYSAFLLWPMYHLPLFTLMTVLVSLTILQRVVWAGQHLR